MNGPLFKQGTAVATGAALRLAGTWQAETDAAAAASPQPSAEEREMERLRERNDALETRLAGMEEQWAGALEAERVRAKAEALREHVRNDALALEKLDSALAEARRLFERRLGEGVEPLAAGLAATAFRRLVEITREEEDWLGRVIARRLRDLVSASVLAVRVSAEDAGDALAARVRGHVPMEGGALTTDASLPPGTARIDLTLGGIDICPAEGAEALVALLDRAGGNFG